VTNAPYRLGFAVKVLGNGGMKSADTRRWQSGPHLSRSLELLADVFDYLDAIGIHVYRMSSSTVPYGTHPDLPDLDYRRQIDECADELAALGAKAGALGLRLSTHPGQYTVLSSPDDQLVRKSSLDLEQDALLLDALGQGPEGAVVVHVGGAYGNKPAALDRWARAFERLSESARARVSVEHDERVFDVEDVLELHRRTGVRVVFDLHHHRCNPARGLPAVEEALAAAYRTWPAGARPKAHLSSPRTELRRLERAARENGNRRKAVALEPPLLDQHADFVTPWDLAELVAAAPGPLDVVVEAKAKDLAVLWLRRQAQRVLPELARAEELGAPALR
jgi:UV DNA damage endonuclease